MASTMVLKLNVKTDGKKGFKAVQKELEKLGMTATKAGNQAKKAGFSFASAFKLNAAYKALNLLTTAVSTAGQEVLKFDKAIRTIGAITNTSASGIESMSKQSRLLGITTEHSSASIAEMALGYNKMGFTVAQTNKMMKASLDLVTTSGSDVESVMSTVGKTMKAFGLQASDTDRIVNVIQNTVSGTAINFEDFGEAMKFVSSLSKTAGMEIEETSALIGQLGNLGLSGTLGGTALKNMLKGLIKPVGEAKDLLAQFDLEGLNLIDTLALLKENLSTRDFLTVFNLRAGSPALGLADIKDDINDFEKKLKNSKKKVGGSAKEIRKALVAQFKLIGDNISTFFVSLNEAYKKFSDSNSTILGTIIKNMQDLNKSLIENPEQLTALITSLEAIGTLASLLVNFVGGILKVVDATVGLNNAVLILGASYLLVKANSLWLFAPTIIKAIVKQKTIVLLLAKAYRGLGVAMKIAAIGFTAVTAGVALVAVIAYNRIAKSANDTEKAVDNLNKTMAETGKIGRNQKVQVYDTLKDFFTPLQDAWKTKKNDFNTKVPSGMRKLFEKSALQRVIPGMKGQKEYKAFMNFGFKAGKDFNKYLEKNGLPKGAFKHLLVYAQNPDTPLKQTYSGVLDVEKTLARIQNALNIEARIGGGPRGSKKADDKTDTTDKDDKGSGKKVEVAVEKTTKIYSDFARIFKLNYKRTEQFYDKFSEFFGKLSPTLDNVLLAKSELSLAKGQGIVNTRGLEREPILQDPSLETYFTQLKRRISLLDESGKSEINQMSLEVGSNRISSIIPEESPNIFKNFANTIKMQKALKQVNKEIDILGKLTPDVSSELDTMFLKQAENIKALNFQANFQMAIDIVQQGLGALNDFFAQSFEQLKERHQTVLNNLQEEKDMAIKMAGDNKNQQMLIEEDFAKKKDKLLKKQEKEREKEAKKQKAVAIGMALINTALAVTSTLAQTFGNMTMKVIASAAVGAIGMLNVAKISAQKFAFGTTRVKSNGQGTSDLIPAFLSEGESVTSKDRIDRIGGSEAFDQVLDEAERSVKSVTDKQPMMIFNNPIGESEYFSELFTRWKEKEQLWYSLS